MKISLHYYVYTVILILILWLALNQKPVVEPKQDYQKTLNLYDSLLKVNRVLEKALTIDKQESDKL